MYEQSTSFRVIEAILDHPEVIAMDAHERASLATELHNASTSELDQTLADLNTKKDS